MKNINYNDINQELLNFTYVGYDLYFIHGWFCAYLSASSESEEDLIIPTYLIIDENKIINEEHFTQTIAELMKIYTSMAESFYEKNKLITPLISLTNNSWELSSLEHKQNLLNWLYGYLSLYLTTEEEVLIEQEMEFLAPKYYPALFNLCIAVLRLSEEVNLSYMSNIMHQDFEDFLTDIKAMWEEEDAEENIALQFKEALKNFDYNDIIAALNDIFYVIRILDEKKISTTNLTENLFTSITKH